MKEAYIIYCLQYGPKIFNENIYEGRTFLVHPGVFQTIKEAEAYCEYHTKKNKGLLYFWYEKTTIGKFDFKNMKKNMKKIRKK